MLKRVLFLTLITSMLFSVAYAMEPEEKPGRLSLHYPKEGNPELSEKDQESSTIKDLYWMLNGKLDESIGKCKARFYEQCAKQLVIYAGSSQKDDPNCGLPQKIAQPFLELCRELTKGLKNKIHQSCVIQAAASLNKTQVAMLLKRKGNSNNPYLTMWHCLVSETRSDQSQYKIIPLLPLIQESNIDELLKINALLEDMNEAMNGVQLVRLVEIFTTLPENHFCRAENYQRVFKKHPKMSVEGKLSFLQQLSQVKVGEHETFLKAAEKGNCNDDIAVGTETFHWVE